MATLLDVVTARDVCLDAWKCVEENVDGSTPSNGAWEARRQLAVESEIRRTNVILEAILMELRK